MLSLHREISSIEVAIHRASAEARADMHRLDSRTRRELNLLYEDTCLQLEDDLLASADQQNNLPVQTLPKALTRVDTSLTELHRGCQELLMTGMMGAAEIGAELWYIAGLKIMPKQLAESAVRYVQAGVDDQGLKLMDQLIRLAHQTRQVVGATLQQQVMTANQAAQTIQTLRQQGKQPPTDLLARMLLQQVDAVACSMRTILLTGQDSSYHRMARLLRSGINRVHVEAYRAAMAAYPRAVGEQLLLEPTDARKGPGEIQTHIDLYGLGKGVYPVGKAPWTQRPAALNFIEAVFADEIAKQPSLY
jgi:hypothetical protein